MDDIDTDEYLLSFTLRQMRNYVDTARAEKRDIYTGEIAGLIDAVERERRERNARLQPGVND